MHHANASVLRLSAIAALGTAAVSTVASAADLGYWFETYATNFAIADLGPVGGVSPPYGGMCFKPGDPNTLLVAQQADSAACTIVALPVTRDGLGHIVGFGAPTVFSSAFGVAGGGLDGGLVVGPQDVLFYATFPDNTLGQIKPGSSAPDKLIDLTPLGVEGSTGGVAFMPPGFPGAGELRVLGYAPGAWHHGHVTPDGAGTFDVTIELPTVELGGGPTSMVFASPKNPGFADAYGIGSDIGYLLVAKWSAGRVDCYYVDEQGDPVLASELPFLDDMDGAVGMAFDPVSGDLLVSTFSLATHIVRVSGFLPPAPPCTADLGGDGGVDGADLGVLLGAWGVPGASPADLDGSGLVDGADLGILLGAWGACGGI